MWCDMNNLRCNRRSASPTTYQLCRSWICWQSEVFLIYSYHRIY